MIKFASLNSSNLHKVAAVFLCLLWSVPCFPFYTVHRVGNINLYIHFQSGLSDISTETIKMQDILEQSSAGRPGTNDIIAAVSDCNNPGSIYLVVWDKQNSTIVAGSSMISLLAVDTVIERKKNSDYVIALLDTEALFGSGYITAQLKISKIKDKLIPADAAPEDEIYCVSRFVGLSAAGFVAGDPSGIVTGGRINFGKPIATLNNFVPF
ncbi:MAG: hypothetical protein WCH04_02780 [Gammaproteobacteria bacterium]